MSNDEEQSMEQHTEGNVSNIDAAMSRTLSIAHRACGLAVRADTEAKFHTIDTETLDLIEKRMVEVDRANRSLGRSATCTSDKLMSLTMMSDSPFRAMRQCLAKIESRRSALKSSLFGLRRAYLDLEEKRQVLKSTSFCTQVLPESANNSIGTQRFELGIEELEHDIKDSILYIEGAVKEIGVYQDAYNQIRVNNGIRENWDEHDAEEAEIGHHIRMAFLHGIRDTIAHGRISIGTMEYLQQFGISPIAAIPFIDYFIKTSNDTVLQISTVGKLAEMKYDGYDDLTEFLDQMSTNFRDSHKKVMERIGLDEGSLISEDFVYKEAVQV